MRETNPISMEKRINNVEVNKADSADVEQLNDDMLDLKDKVPFKFGIDGNGNYGYFKDGADTVTPFSTGTANHLVFMRGSSAPTDNDNVKFDVDTKLKFGVEADVIEDIVTYDDTAGNEHLIFNVAGKYKFALSYYRSGGYNTNTSVYNRMVNGTITLRAEINDNYNSEEFELDLNENSTFALQKEGSSGWWAVENLTILKVG